MNKRFSSRLCLLLSASTLALTSCSLFESSSSSFSFDVEGYSFSGIEDRSHASTETLSNSAYVSREPFSTEYPGVSYEDVSRPSQSIESEEPIDTYEESSTSHWSEPERSSSSSSSEATSSGEETSSPAYDPSLRRFPVLDLPKGDAVSDYKVVEDAGYYASFAVELAMDEIEALGFETFHAYAVIPSEDGTSAEKIVTGIGFTNREIYAVSEDTAIYSCGFMQVLNKDVEEYVLTEEDAGNGLPCFNTDDDTCYIIESNIFVDGLSGIYEGYFFSYKQTSTFGIEIDVHKAVGELEDFADEDLDLFDFDARRYRYKASLFKQKTLDAYTIYGARSNIAYQNAIAAMDYLIRLQDENGFKVALNSIVLVSYDLLASLMLEQQRPSIGGVLFDQLKTTVLAENQYFVMGEDGTVKIATDYNYAAQGRTTQGILKTMMALGMLAGGFATIMLTGGTAAPAVSGIMLASGAAQCLFAADTLISAMQEFVYAGQGNVVDESDGVILALMKKAFGDEAGEALYFATTLVLSVGNTFLGPVQTVMNTASSMGLSVFQTVIRVTRAVAVHAVKLALTAGAAKFANDIVDKALTAIGVDENWRKIIGLGTAAVVGTLVYKGLDRLDWAFNISGFSGVSRVPVTESGSSVSKQTYKETEYGEYAKELYKEPMSSAKNASLRRLVGHMGNEQKIQTPVKVRTIYESSPELVYGMPLGRKKKLVRELSDNSVAGFYDPESHVIYIDSGIVENDGLKTLRTIAHLMRHVYQLENADFFSPMMEALTEDNYADPTNTYAYLTNIAEIDAENYADYIQKRATHALEEMSENPDIEDVENIFSFADPDSYREGGAQ